MWIAHYHRNLMAVESLGALYVAVNAPTLSISVHFWPASTINTSEP